MTHVDIKTLGEFVLNLLPPNMSSSISDHVTNCPICEKRLQLLSEPFDGPGDTPAPRQFAVERITRHVEIASDQQTIILDLEGRDGPNQVARLTALLEQLNMNIEVIDFKLTSDLQFYAMKVEAKGEPEGARRVQEIFASKPVVFVEEPAYVEVDSRVPVENCVMLDFDMGTPDRKGITADVSKLVGMERFCAAAHVCEMGSLISLTGSLQESNRLPEGCPEFRLQGTIAAPSKRAMDEILRRLHGFKSKEPNCFVAEISRDDYSVVQFVPKGGHNERSFAL